METKVKENGQAKVNTVKADKTPKFVSGSPVNVLSKAHEEKQTEQPKPEECKGQVGAEPTKVCRLIVFSWTNHFH